MARAFRVDSRAVADWGQIAVAGGDLDILGWCILLFILAVVSYLFFRWVRRTDSMPTWPTATALVTEVESMRGSPVGTRYGFASDHCKVWYAFSLGEATYEGSFALMTEDHEFADDTAEKLRGGKFIVRYDPKNPKDSVLVDDSVLGKKVIQVKEIV